jgi:diphthine-ammonia ligase
VKPRAAVSWSGGKDSYLALHRSLSQFDVVAALTMFNDDGTRSRSHGLRPNIIAAQMQRLGLRHVCGRASWTTYETAYCDALRELRALDVTHVIFGDIMYESNRAFPERVCAAEGLAAVEPLWGEPTDALYREFIATGATAQIVTVRGDLMSPAWLGRPLTIELLPELQKLGVDACGEHGEYHTVVVNAPLFSTPIDATMGRTVAHDGCWAIDIVIDERELAGDAAGAARI